MYCISAAVFTTSLWDHMGVREKDSKSSEFLRGYPEITKMRSWRQEVEERFNAVHLIECLKIPTCLCSGREVNKKLKKLCIYCIRSVYDVVDTDFLEGAYLLQVWRKVILNRGLLQPCIVQIECLLQLSAIEICKLTAFAVSLTRSTVLSQQFHRRLRNFFVFYLLAIGSDAALVSSTFEIIHSSIFESR